MSVDCSDGEPLDVDNERMVRARKNHRCDACKETIRRGDLYKRHFIAWEGTCETVLRCARCDTIYQELCKLHRAKNKDAWESTWPAWRLDCGDSFKRVFDREPPPELAELAFLTADEMQRRLANG